MCVQCMVAHCVGVLLRILKLHWIAHLKRRLSFFLNTCNVVYVFCLRCVCACKVIVHGLLYMYYSTTTVYPNVCASSCVVLYMDCLCLYLCVLYVCMQQYTGCYHPFIEHCFCLEHLKCLRVCFIFIGFADSYNKPIIRM